MLGAAAAGAASAAAGCTPVRRDGGPGAEQPAPALDPASWESVRAQFAAQPGEAHLARYVFASHPAAVRAAVERHRAGLDRDAVGYLHAHEERLDAAVAAAAAAYLGTRADQVAFTDSTTMGLGLLYAGLALRPGEEIVTTEHDFYATHESLRLRARRDGATVRRIRLYDDPARATAAAMVAAVAAGVTPRTRILALTWVHSSTGVRLPVAELAEAARARSRRVLVCVDGVHGFGAEDAGPDDLRCDFLVSGTHKWLFGPRGTGVVWGSAAGWHAYTPVIPTFDRRGFGGWLGFAGAGPPPGPAATPGGYHSFEHRWALAEAFDLHQRIGRARVAARTRELAAALREGLAGLRGLRLVTPADPGLSAGIVCCEVPGVPVGEAVARLAAHRVVATATPYQPSYLRFGTTMLNTAEDVEAALRAVRTLL
ncbi:MAG TPA: aminotransferase class V-fold PLP-dependent enzyme [Pilimelia sp.]|nr:aminotransferase class V-fold PLP-dependent enzyme [Pilimelia sp.]